MSGKRPKPLERCLAAAAVPSFRLLFKNQILHVGIEKLTPYALRELIQGIYVETSDKSTGKRRQTIHIKYDGIGFIPLDVLMNGKTA